VNAQSRRSALHGELVTRTDTGQAADDQQVAARVEA
jgi:hypothetical protein